MTPAVGVRNLVVSIILALALLVAVPVILLAGASLAGAFEIAVRSEQSGMMRGLETSELVGASLVGGIVAVVGVIWVRQLRRRVNSQRGNAGEGRRAQ